MELAIRDAEQPDLPQLRDIYNEVVLNTTAIWNDEPRTPEAFATWFAERTAQSWPVLVAVATGQIAGYASYGPFRVWSGYRATVESSIYLGPSYRGQGMGSHLLAALIDRAQGQGLHVMVAGIDADNSASLRLHEKLGFTHAAHFHQVGRKFGRWLDLVFLERMLLDRVG